MTHQYIATVKQGRSRIGIAGINLGDDSCIATASKVFAALGIASQDVQWGDYTASCKNYIQSPNFLAIDADTAAQHLAIENKRVADFLATCYA